MMSRLLGSVALITMSALLATACSAQTPPAGFAEGEDYQRIEPPQASPSDTIEVVEVFGYSCIHCANADPVIQNWKKDLAEDVSFVMMPAVFGGVWEAFARAYYTAETMGVLDKTHAAVFRAVHVDRRPIRGLDDIAELYGEHGVDAEQFLATMNSFAVNAKIERARQTVPRWGVTATPTMVVAGKYRVTARAGEGSFERMLRVVDFLVERERAERRVEAS